MPADPGLFGIVDLVRTEAEVEAQTDSAFAGLVREYSGFIDTLLKLFHFRGDLADPETDLGYFEFFVATHYLQAPYSLWALFRLWRSGHYLEATILLRSLLEVLVQLRYFESHTDLVKVHIESGQSIRFRTMFDKLSPGYYEKHYGLLLSSIVHGKTGPALFRFDRSEANPPRVRIGCEFDSGHAAFIMNYVVTIVFGLFNVFPRLLPRNTLTTAPGVESDHQAAIRWLEGAMRSHRAGFPESEEFYALTDPLVR